MQKIALKKHVTGMMVGGSGYGKTSIAEQKAKDWGYSFLRWDCAKITDPEDFFGSRAAKNGSTVDENNKQLFIPSTFVSAITQGRYVVLLDEVNRMDPTVANVLLPLLDHAGRSEYAGHDIIVGPEVVFLATANVGHQFTGTVTRMDQAFLNRFGPTIRVTSLPEAIEKKVLMARTGVNELGAEAIVDVMGRLRQLNNNGKLTVDASTRVSLAVAEFIAEGMKIPEVIRYIIVNKVSAEEAKEVVDVVKEVEAKYKGKK